MTRVAQRSVQPLTTAYDDVRGMLESPSRRVSIAAPFISASMGVTLARALPPARATAGARELRLLTDLNPRVVEQGYLSVRALQSSVRPALRCTTSPASTRSSSSPTAQRMSAPRISQSRALPAGTLSSASSSRDQRFATSPTKSSGSSHTRIRSPRSASLTSPNLRRSRWIAKSKSGSRLALCPANFVTTARRTSGAPRLCCCTCPVRGPRRGVTRESGRSSKRATHECRRSSVRTCTTSSRSIL